MKPTTHLPVMPNEILATLRPRKGHLLIDCTLGLGGHSAVLLPHLLPTGHLIGIDFDPHSLTLAKQRLAKIPGAKNHVHLFQNNFAALPTILAQFDEGNPLQANAILADLGVSSPQIDDPARGFSYRQPGPLDMRMDPTRGQSAAALLARMSEQQISEALLEYGDETDAPQIASLIIERRQIKPIETTQELTAVVCQARRFTLERAAGAKLHPAARTFQALRILVNREMANLDRLLAVLPDCLKKNGTAAIITFHSGEDRRVKKSFLAGKRSGIYQEISPGPILATAEEIAQNPRARSAKLRWAVRG